MKTVAIVRTGGIPENNKVVQKKLEEALCSYVRENFSEMIAADKKNIQYSISMFMREKLLRICSEEQGGSSMQLLSYMVIAADWDRNLFVSVQWGKGMIFAEAEETRCIISSPCYRESLIEFSDRIQKNDISKIYIRRGALQGIKRFRLSENGVAGGMREEIVEGEIVTVLY